MIFARPRVVLENVSHAEVYVAGIGFGSQSGSGFTSAGSSAHTLGDFQGGNAVGRQVPSSTGSTGGIPPSLNASYSREVLNAGCVPPAATAVGVERAVDRDGGRERERSRWDRDQDQITNSKQDPREASSLEDGKPDHQSDRYDNLFSVRVSLCRLCMYFGSTQFLSSILARMILLHAYPVICYVWCITMSFGPLMIVL